MINDLSEPYLALRPCLIKIGYLALDLLLGAFSCKVDMSNNPFIYLSSVLVWVAYG